MSYSESESESESSFVLVEVVEVEESFDEDSYELDDVETENEQEVSGESETEEDAEEDEKPEELQQSETAQETENESESRPSRPMIQPETLQETAKAQEETVTSQISGEWRLVEARNLQHYLERIGANAEVQSRWRLGHIHFQFEAGEMTAFTTHEDQVYHETVATLRAPKRSVRSVCTHFVKDNRLMTCKSNLETGEEYLTTERFVIDGLLHITNTRNGVTCQRIYRKVLV
ncbi:unnamed protein product [Caenorhabditis sp. 36 PRJEB53466]|nr:unnamed protein product [Caenorhabditis sp. 36 PRJEB53466]